MPPGAFFDRTITVSSTVLIEKLLVSYLLKTFTALLPHSQECATETLNMMNLVHVVTPFTSSKLSRVCILVGGRPKYQLIFNYILLHIITEQL
jgi:hypothetical protein